MKIPTARKLPSGAWHIQLRLGGESISITEPTERACIKRAQLIKAEHLAGKRLARQPDADLTLTAAIDRYVEQRSQSLSPATVRKYKALQSSDQYAALMPRKLSTITAAQWRTATNDALRTYAAKTVRVSLGLLRTVAKASGVALPEIRIGGESAARAKELTKAQFLEPDEILAFVTAAAKSKYAVALLLALSSLRISEIDGLDWANVEGHTVKVVERRILDESGAYVTIPGGKTASSVRVVESLIPALDAALDAARQPSGKVLTCSQQTLRRECERVCKAAGVPVVGVHGLRHSFASLTAHLRISKQVSQTIGGWANDRIMDDVYTHVASADLATSKQAIRDFYATPPKNANKNANICQDT